MARLRCDCKKTNGITESVIITTKNKVISINQLNHKAPEKSDATAHAAVQTGM